MYDLSLKFWDVDVLVVLIEAQDWDGIMERSSFAYAFSLVEALMSLRGFHKDETIYAIPLDVVDLFLAAVHGGWRWWSVGAAISPLVITRDSLAHGGFYDNCLVDRVLCVLMAHVELMARRWILMCCMCVGGSASHTEGVIAAMGVWHCYRIRKSELAMARKQKKSYGLMGRRLMGFA
nr:hypothetical protein [Tanacetum cinerariifolium]